MVAVVKIPRHLRWLPKTSQGIPVPYVAHWTAEEGTARLEPCTHDDLRGQGDPVLGQMSFRRQREVIPKVGFTLIPAEPQILYDLISVSEPLSCRSCIDFARKHCPDIARSVDAGGSLVAVYKMRKLPSLVQLTGDPELDTPFAPIDWIPVGGALGYVKLGLEEVDIYTGVMR